MINKKYNKTNIILLFGIIFVVSFVTITYSALNTNMYINGNAVVRVNSDIRVTNLRMINASNGAYETYNSKYSKDSTSIFATLPSNSSISYEVEVTNKTSFDYVIIDILESSNTNSLVKYELETEIYDVYNPGITKFKINLTNNTSTEQTETLKINYKFIKDETPTIVMNDLPSWNTKGDSYPINYTYDVGNIGLKETNCKSNISGVVTNLDELLTGNHTITCSVTTKSGKTASVSKTTEITYKAYTVKNLVADSSFENGMSNWRYGTSPVHQVISGKATTGSKSIYCTSTNSNACWFATDIDNINSGNKVYMRANVYSTTSEYGGQMAITINGAGDGLHFFPKSINKYETHSGILTARNTFNTLQIGVASTRVGTAYYDDIMVVDLTKIFGSGKEPNVDWCNKHIKYYDGSKTIYK